MTSGSKKLNSLTQTSLHSVLTTLQEMLVQENAALNGGFAQSLDPRLKMLGAVMFLIMISLLSNLRFLFFFAIASFGLALMLRIDAFYFLKRAWLSAPLFALLISGPLIFNWVSAGPPLWVLHRFPASPHLGPLTLPDSLSVTTTGVLTVTRMVLRVGDSVSVVLLLVLTTSWQKLFKALKLLNVPSFFVFALSITYSHLHALVRLLLEMNLGKRSRTLRRSRFAAEQEWVANRVGYLFQRSDKLIGEIHDAMRSRGYQGETRLLESLQWQKRDSIVALIMIFCCIGVVVFACD